jgi:hypothetical protein
MSSCDTFLCPVCGFGDLAEAPWSNGAASDEICPCCGTHFGYDDAAGGDAGRREALHRELRRRWEVQGFPWFSRSTTAPAGWAPSAQVRVFDEEW